MRFGRDYIKGVKINWANEWKSDIGDIVVAKTVRLRYRF